MEKNVNLNDLKTDDCNQSLLIVQEQPKLEKGSYKPDQNCECCIDCMGYCLICICFPCSLCFYCCHNPDHETCDCCEYCAIASFCCWFMPASLLVNCFH